MPASEWNQVGGLFVPNDERTKARQRIVEATRLAVKLLGEAGISELANPHFVQALAPDVFRLILHEGLVED